MSAENLFRDFYGAEYLVLYLRCRTLFYLTNPPLEILGLNGLSSQLEKSGPVLCHYLARCARRLRTALPVQRLC